MESEQKDDPLSRSVQISGIPEEQMQTVIDICDRAKKGVESYSKRAEKKELRIIFINRQDAEDLVKAGTFPLGLSTYAVTKPLRMDIAAPTTDKSKLLKHYDSLTIYIDPQFGLLPKLLKYKLINHRTLTEIKAQNTYYKQNIMLLDHLITLFKDSRDVDIYSLFTKSMKENSQQHVVNYLDGDGNVEEYGDDRPLKKLEIEHIDANYDQLSEGVLIDTLILARLFQEKAITSKHKDCIESEITDTEKVEQLLDILRVRSAGALREFWDTLRSNGYKELAWSVPEEKAVLIRMDQTFQDDEDMLENEEEKSEKEENIFGKAENKVEKERMLSNTFNGNRSSNNFSAIFNKANVHEAIDNEANVHEAIDNEAIVQEAIVNEANVHEAIDNEANEHEAIVNQKFLMEQHNLKIVLSAQTGSITVFISCPTLIALIQLEEMIAAHKIQDYISGIFKELCRLNEIKLTPTKLVVNNQDLESARKYLTAKDISEKPIQEEANVKPVQQETASSMSKVMMLPVVMEQVLMKSFVLMHVRGYSRTHQSIQSKIVYESLTSVCATWRKVPKYRRPRPWFSTTLRAQLHTVENLFIVQESIAKHRAFLRSMLECQYGLLDELKSRGVLTTERVNLIECKFGTYEKNYILLNAITETNKVFKMQEFLSALDVTYQSHLSTYILNNEDIDSSNKSKPLDIDSSKKSKPLDIDSSKKSKYFDIDSSKKSKPLDIDSSKKSKPFDIDSSKKSKPSDIDSSKKSKYFDIDSSKKSKPFDIDSSKKRKYLDIDSSKKSKPFDIDSSKKSKPLDIDSSKKSKPKKSKPLDIDSSKKIKSLDIDSSKKSKPNRSKPKKSKALDIDSSNKSKPLDIDSSNKSNPLDIDSSDKIKPLDIDSSNKSKPLDTDSSNKSKPLNSSNSSRPLTAYELKKFTLKRTFLVNEIILEGFLNILSGVECISASHKAGIENETDRYDKVRHLLDIIQRRSFAHYELFLDCLRSTHQHVYEVLQGYQVGDGTIQASITKHRAFLRSMLECQYGLLDELESRCVLTDEQLDLIKSKVPTYKKNDILLREISKETEVLKLNEFLSALEATHQSHLATYVVNNGIIDSSNKNRPLTVDELRKFRSKRIFLVKEISINGLLDSLYQAGCISRRHMAGIKEHKDSNDKIRQLLDIIQRRSFTQYQLFLSCLRSTHQEHVWDLLERDGVVQSVNASVRSPNRKRREIIEEIIKKQILGGGN